MTVKLNIVQNVLKKLFFTVTFEGFCVKLNCRTWTPVMEGVFLHEIIFPMIYNMPCTFFDTNIAPGSWINVREPSHSC